VEFQSFVVNIPEGKEIESGYVELAHKTRYTLCLGNRRSVRCEARVEIDGKLVGSWCINSESEIRLEHPVDDDGYFTFYSPRAVESRNAGLGLISVTFTPEEDFSKYFDLLPQEDIGLFPGEGFPEVPDPLSPVPFQGIWDEDPKVTIDLQLVEAGDNAPRSLRGVAMYPPVLPLLK